MVDGRAIYFEFAERRVMMGINGATMGALAIVGSNSQLTRDNGHSGALNRIILTIENPYRII